MNSKEYEEKRRSPKWQKKRLELFQKANWKCSICSDEENELHVHHLHYKNGREPWEYEDKELLVVCSKCHKEKIHKKKELFKPLPTLSRYLVFQYHHIDDLRCMRPLRIFFEERYYDEQPTERYIDLLTQELEIQLAKKFSDYGWEGDGDIGCIFIPPCFVINSDTWCDVVFHVKQYNNGTSFLAIPEWLKFELPEEWT